MTEDNLQSFLEGKITPLREKIARKRIAILEQLRRHEIDGLACSRRLSDVVDEYIIEAAQVSLKSCQADISILLDGGNGRREVCPKSDLDIAIIVPDILPKEFDECYERFYYAMDELRRVGIPATGSLRVRTVDEFEKQAQEDHRDRTTLLERRFLWGSQALFQSLDSKIDIMNADPVSYIMDRISKRKQRLKDPKNQRDLLNPDIKEGYGGLRDYQNIMWIARALKGGNAPKDLVKHKFLSSEEAQDLQEAYAFLLTLRCHLHDAIVGNAGHRLNSLIPEHQDMLAKRLPEFGGVEALMRRYYQSMRTIGYLSNVVGAAVYEREIDKKGTFKISRPRVSFQNNVIEDPKDMLGIYLEARRYDVPLHHTALRLIQRNVSLFNPKVRKDPEVNSEFLKILMGQRNEDLLIQMQEIGLLQALLPCMSDIDSLMQFDANHAFTVDRHTFKCLGHIRMLQKDSYDEHEVFTVRLADNLSKSDWRVLYVTTLLHDIGKGKEQRLNLQRGKPEITHHKIGEARAPKICKDLGLSIEEGEKVAWLIRHHLDLHHMAVTLDPERSDTIMMLADKVPTVKHLDLLALLTTADIMGVANDKWGFHENASIQKLYDATAHYLVKKELIAKEDMALPKSYEGEVQITLSKEFNDSANILTTSAPDQLFLLENIIGTLSMDDHNIRAVESSMHEYEGQKTAVNRIIFETQKGGVLSTKEQKILCSKLKSAAGITTRIDFAESMKSGRRPGQAFPVEPMVEIANDLASDETFIKVRGRDRKGLLYDMCSCLNDLGLSVTFSQIVTHGHVAENSFYVTDRDGNKIQSQDGNLHRIYKNLIDCARS